MKTVQLVKCLDINIWNYLSEPKKAWKIFLDKECTDRFGTYSTKAKVIADVKAYNFKVA